MTLQQNIMDKNDDELARYQAGLNQDTTGFILAEREWQRRAIVKAQSLQYEHNRKLLREQVKWMKFSIIMTLSAAIAAAILSWCLGLCSLKLLQSEQQEGKHKKPTSQVVP